jgi:hypothetical protein
MHCGRKTASCDSIRLCDAGGDLSVKLKGFAPIYWVAILEAIVAIGVFHDAA